jgi:DNA-binding MarR family transcriptional regulator
VQVSSNDTARCLAEFLRFLTQSAGNDFVRAVEEEQLSLTQLKAMHVIGGSDEELSLNGLAERLGGLSLPTLSRAVDSLVQRGHVKRTEDTSDRRVKRLRLAAKGRRTIDRLMEIRVAELHAALETLTDEERDRLAAALEPILERRA